MRSHSIFQEQKLTVLAPLTFSICDAKYEQSVKKVKAAGTTINLAEQEPLNSAVRKKLLIAEGPHNSAKGLLPSFFGSCPPANSLQAAVPSNFTLGDKGVKKQKLFLTQESSTVIWHFMESSSSFSDTFILNKKLVHRVKTLHSMQSSDKSNLFKQFFTELVELQKRVISKPNVQVILAFSSLEKKDLDWAFHLFQSYLTNLTDRLIAYNGFEKGKVNKNLNKKLFQTKVNKFYSPKKLNQALPSRPRYKVKTETNLPLGKVRLETQLLASETLPATESKFRQEKLFIERGTTVAGIARAVRSLNEPLKVTPIPLSTQLYTVIRSPHVFKKTREQFATTQYKRVIKLNFRSNAALRLFVDSFILLKLPVEVKVVVRDL
uniref:Ribosomal protein S10 n=1 Tax=Tupiella akineta TaxID=160070 RepID=Q6UVP9_TUPAK|nr:ribosomal protein S10 [Tupiella akineta]AAQ18775.1 ribosomal protein S10 [Tupiella akineta]